jgi:KEOPS complex subunit Cgi121
MLVVEGEATVEDVDTFVERLREIGAEYGVAVQAFDARYVVDRAHLDRAVALANRAFDRGENVARDRAVELLLFAAGRRQINRALEMGVKEGEVPAVVVIDDGSGPEETTTPEADAATAVRGLLDPAETLGQYDSERVRAFFEVTDAELAATDADLSALVRERVAMLVVER